MAKLLGSIVDQGTGERVEARVQIISSSGTFVYPPKALLKVGTGSPFFYSEGTFEVDVSRGPTQVIIERGTEYVPAKISVDASVHGNMTVDVQMERWTALGSRGWHPGNTHIHYDEKEQRPDERLALDPRIEDLRMTAVSILKRSDLEYATNKYSPGMLTEFSSAHHYVQCGEENRHNAIGTHAIGYGHIMLLNIRNVVEPVSRGLLVDAFDPDYPPLSHACDDTHRQGGTVIWCHNGQGMEAPVAAVLGEIDAFNLFDGTWMDPEYDVYYNMLNAGIKLPASTGSDWFISSANRVYVHTGGAFDYEHWLQALRDGRTFITNGPVLSLTVQGEEPGTEIEVQHGKSIPTVITWESHYPVTRVELVFNGKVVAQKYLPDGSTQKQLETDVKMDSNGWLVARLSSDARDSFFQPIWAHTSPVYVKTGMPSPEREISARWFVETIENSLDWVRTRSKFYSDVQRREVVDLFLQGQELYRAMLNK